jgi:glycosyltransferase involved in cell wall biosynthesis
MLTRTSRKAKSYILTHLRNGEYDVVHVEGYYLMPNLPSLVDPPIVLVEHNIECLLSLQKQQLTYTEPERRRYHTEYYRTLEWERRFWKQSSLCVTLTSQDQNTISHFEPDVNVQTIPNGTTMLRKTYRTSVSPLLNASTISYDYHHTIVFVANFAYQPNEDAALYFTKSVFPIIKKGIPNVKLLLVGNDPGEKIRLLGLNENVKVTGFVRSVFPYYRLADVVVCPLRIGGGIKVKVLEALQAGKPIVSTSIGAQGLQREEDGPLIVADDKSLFAQKVIELLRDPEKRYILQERACRYSKSLPSWDQISKLFSISYEQLVGSSISKTEPLVKPVITYSGQSS